MKTAGGVTPVSIKRFVIALIVALSLALSALPASADPGDGSYNITWENVYLNITWE